MVKTPFPAFFACLFKSSFTPSEDSAILCELFGQSFANRFLQNRDFFSTHRNSIPYTRGVLMCLLGFWPSGPKPCGGNHLQKRATRRSRCAPEPSRIPLLFVRGLNKNNSMLKTFVFKKISTIDMPKSSKLHCYVNKVRKNFIMHDINVITNAIQR